MNERTKVWTDRINRLIQLNEWTLRDAAFHFAVSDETIHQWSKGRRKRPPTLKFLRKLIALEMAYGKSREFVAGVWERGRFRPFRAQGVGGTQDSAPLAGTVGSADTVSRVEPILNGSVAGSASLDDDVAPFQGDRDADDQAKQLGRSPLAHG